MKRAKKILGASALLAAVASSPPASACGGTFCDNVPPGQPPMPVDQTGEVILFSLEGDQVEAHIQIQYSGSPERFAWIIPLQSEPEFSVGSQQLFVNALNGTVPVFSLTSQNACTGQSSSSGSSSGCGASGDESMSGGSFRGGGGVDDGNSAVDVAGASEQVGAFDITVLRGGPSEVLAWLTDNGYLEDPEAAPILADYAARGHVFAALKLVPGTGVDEIHPLVVRYQGNEPCIPLELTRIAAAENMRIRAFFLGDRRTVPVGGYKHVTLAAPRLDFMNTGANYQACAERAFDAPTANGRAFITEYAGTSAAIDTSTLVDARWDATAFVGLEPGAVADTLEAQGLLTCNVVCEPNHPLLGGLLQRHLPPPDGVAPGTYYACVSCYESLADTSGWDAAAFAADLDERIMEPARHAVALVRDNPYVTRLYTALSPAEMTEDPIFAELPPGQGSDVSPALGATMASSCGGDRMLELPDGRFFYLAVGTTAPAPVPDDMPWVETVEEYSATGERVVLVDQAERIDAMMATLNERAGYLPMPPDDAEGGGCTLGGGGCSIAGRAPTAVWVLGVLGLGGAVRRLTRRARR